jgi:hypothetical protein
MLRPNLGGNQFGRDSDCKPKDRNKQKGTWIHLHVPIAGDGFEHPTTSFYTL